MKKQYKLIKEYPTSPEFGTIVTVEGNSIIYSGKKGFNGTYKIKESTIRDKYLEFWEEVPQLEYEILQFVNNGKKTVRKGFIVNMKDAKLDVGDQFLPESHYLNSTSWDIHSVKRISDGKVFTLKDTAYPKTAIGNICEITKIEFCDAGYLRFKGESFSGKNSFYIGIDDLVKYKKPLFTTEDGVDIFEGDNYWYVNYLFTLCLGIGHYKNTTKKGMYNFSTPELAEKYIKDNQIKYTKAELFDFAADYGGDILISITTGNPPIKMQKCFDKWLKNKKEQ